jgi:hypothetical protein
MNAETSTENAYLGEVLAEQAQVQRALKQQPIVPTAGAGPAKARAPAPPPIDFRITGFWRWKTVVVPPNVHVVHTRRGHPEPVTLGLGISFRFDPATDAFLLIPASMQTIVLSAKCVTAERQGVLVQAYVQWLIDDLRTAYRRLDFSDPADPMGVVDVQLREQAEAVLKDKVATMSIDQVLADKLPIIEELTQRLRLLAEGTSTGPDSSGLGLKIVTVQIKEAVVSSPRLWENLQKPFRAERAKVARLAELEAEEEVAARERSARQAREAAELETQRALGERRAAVEREQYDREQAERGRRHRLEQEAEQRSLAECNATEVARKAAALELALKDLELEARRIEQEVEAVRRRAQLDEARAGQDRARALAALQVEEDQSRAAAARGEREVALLEARQAVENKVSEGAVRSRLIEQLPAVAQALPKPEEFRVVSVAGDGGGLGALAGFLAGALGLAEGVWKKRPEGNGAVKEG